ncbi:MAG: serine/threonine-protein kinase [Myxococcota bacterium]
MVLPSAPAPRLSSDRPPENPDDPRYLHERLLGRGGAGDVELVFDKDLGRRVARKKLRMEHRQDATLLQAFLEEAMLTGALEHPGIVPVYDIGVTAGEGPWYTMKRLTGEPLSTVLSRLRNKDPEARQRFDLGRLIEIFVQTLRAVAFAHERGVIHCDLKPGNVLVAPLGEVVVVDWGLAKVLGEGGRQQARARLWSGSPGYMPPEQAESPDIDQLDARSDVWALGAILYELLTLVVPHADAAGTAPDDGSWRPIVPASKRAPRDRHVPAELERIVERALQRAPADRYPSVSAMLAEVEAWLAGSRERERRDAVVHAAAREVDAAVMRTAGAGGRLDASNMDAWEAAKKTLVKALDEVPEREELRRRASTLYWCAFRALHGDDADVAGLGELGRRAAALLDELATRAPPEAEAGGIEPWLEALDEIADHAPQVAALAARVRLLRATDVFGGLGGHELVPLAAALGEVEVAAGEALFREGDEGDALWILESGEVAASAGGEHLRSMLPPACFGEVALADRLGLRTATVVAVSDVRALTLTAERFDALVRRHGAVALGVMRVLAERLRTATARELERIAAARAVAEGAARASRWRWRWPAPRHRHPRRAPSLLLGSRDSSVLFGRQRWLGDAAARAARRAALEYRRPARRAGLARRASPSSFHQVRRLRGVVRALEADEDSIAPGPTIRWPSPRCGAGGVADGCDGRRDDACDNSTSTWSRAAPARCRAWPGCAARPARARRPRRRRQADQARARAGQGRRRRRRHRGHERGAARRPRLRAECHGRRWPTPMPALAADPRGEELAGYARYKLGWVAFNRGDARGAAAAFGEARRLGRLSRTARRSCARPRSISRAPGPAPDAWRDAMRDLAPAPIAAAATTSACLAEQLVDAGAAAAGAVLATLGPELRAPAARARLEALKGRLPPPR